MADGEASIYFVKKFLFPLSNTKYLKLHLAKKNLSILNLSGEKISRWFESLDFCELFVV